jgi:DICT domain-containing protein
MPDRPSIYAAVASVDEMARPQLLRKATLTRLARAIEHETLASASAPLVFGAFQREAAYRAVEHRWKRLARQAEAATVFADFGVASHPDRAPAELPIDLDDAIGNEWAVIVDAPMYAACLLAWEHPTRFEPMGPHDERRTFEAIWTMHPRAVRRAAEVAARLAAQIEPAYGGTLEGLLADRPLATETPVPALTALTNRAIAYLDR